MSPPAWYGSWISKALFPCGTFGLEGYSILETIDSICKWGQDNFSLSFWHIRLQLDNVLFQWKPDNGIQVEILQGRWYIYIMSLKVCVPVLTDRDGWWQDAR